MKKGILFDLDGTLWDSAEGVCESWNVVRERRGLPYRVDVAEMHRQMGKTMEAIAYSLFPDQEKGEALRILQECTDYENEYLLTRGGILYDGLEETLGLLREQGFFLAVVSNCQKGYIEAFLDHHGLGSCFDDTECFGNTGRGKGENIRRVAERNGLDRTLYVGDTLGDWEASREAGTDFLHAAYGFGQVPEGTPAVRELRELPAACAKWAADAR